MKVVVQRVKRAKVIIDNNINGAINNGYLLLVGFNQEDNKEIVDIICKKICNLRIFDDINGKMNLSLKDVDGKILSISQFTLYADTSKGNRPSFVEAMSYDKASDLYDYFNEKLRSYNIDVETGIFGSIMEVDFINDGPVTILLDSKEL